MYDPLINSLTNLHVFVSDAIRRTPLTRKMPDAVVQQALTKWQQSACDQNGGREARQNIEQVCNTPPTLPVKEYRKAAASRVAVTLP
jgi:hypothetical protein